MLVLGISDMEHDSAIVLINNSSPLAALEEDKLSRVPKVGGVPRLALDHCLHQVGAHSGDVSVVGLAGRPTRAWLRHQRFCFGRLLSRRELSIGNTEREGISRGLNRVRLLRGLFEQNAPLLDFEHHLCHAASAYYASEFDRALVLTLDESGDMWSGLVALGEGDNLRILKPIPFPNSLGWIYTRATELAGFKPHRDEHKTVWLSSEGTPDFITAFRSLLSQNSGAAPVLNPRYLSPRLPAGWRFSQEFYRILRVPESTLSQDRSAQAAIARSAQDFLEETVAAWAESNRQMTGAKYLCLAGGVFLNTLLVRALEQKTGFAEIFVQPVAGNPGTALGAAYLARKRLTGRAGREPLRHLYLGPQFNAESIKAVLDNCKIAYRYLPDERTLLEEATQLLLQDKIVAWYQGRMEFGLRALGNRTILASPFSPYVVENLNQFVKHRESFHPFALSVPNERASEFFDCTTNCRFLVSTGTLSSKVDGLERFACKGKEIRVHTVEKETNPLYWNLLSKFGEKAPAPILVNTSFNLFGEPLVSEPRDAVRTFYCSGIDALVVGNFLVKK